jgi:hypothetical protein
MAEDDVRLINGAVLSRYGKWPLQGDDVYETHPRRISTWLAKKLIEKKAAV